MWRALVITVLLVGCGGGSGGGGGATTPTATGEIDCVPKGTDLIDFAQVKAEVFAPSCVGCHSNAGIFVPDTFAVVKARIGGIANAISTGRMPKAPAPALTADQKNLVAAWVNIGAPENIDDVKLCD